MFLARKVTIIVVVGLELRCSKNKIRNTVHRNLGIGSVIPSYVHSSIAG